MRHFSGSITQVLEVKLCITDRSCLASSLGRTGMSFIVPFLKDLIGYAFLFSSQEPSMCAHNFSEPENLNWVYPMGPCTQVTKTFLVQNHPQWQRHLGLSLKTVKITDLTVFNKLYLQSSTQPTETDLRTGLHKPLLHPMFWPGVGVIHVPLLLQQTRSD